MAQARRKTPPRRPATRRPTADANLKAAAILLAGMLIGSLATILWHGVSGGDGVGAGIRRLVDGAEPPAAGRPPQPATQPAAKPSTDFAFFTVLPEIEILAPPEAPPEDAAPPDAAPGDGVFMLQAGSYRHRADADRLKASLALGGLVSAIQKVSIQGRGDFYRVRLGPYPDYADMVYADQQLTDLGIQALRLKMSDAK